MILIFVIFQLTKQNQGLNFDDPIINPKKPPPLINNDQSSNLFNPIKCLNNYTIWMMLRRFDSFDQVVPRVLIVPTTLEA